MTAGGGGGAWKVAFADFMTAMMALFLVLWISSQDKKILIATSKYFQSPFQSPMEDHSGIMPFNKESNSSSSPKESEDGASKSKSQDKQVELSYLNSVAADFYRMLQMDQTNNEKPIDIQVTSDGLRVTLFDRNKQPLFKDNGIEFTDWGVHLMQSMAWLIDRNHFKVTIDGHTREGLTLPRPDYTAWELSSDRANAARRSLVYYAVDASQIERVAGYADTKPIPMEKPTSESNQRITLSLSLGKNGKDKAKLPGVTKKDAPKSKAPTEEPKFMLPSQTETKPSAAAGSPAAKPEEKISAPENLKPVALNAHAP